jgi:hypothetical protein|tara:strand:- start:59 stop:952 length:894 start_codon:yes stop_codon:yes gene_type:complete
MKKNSAFNLKEVSQVLGDYATHESLNFDVLNDLINKAELEVKAHGKPVIRELHHLACTGGTLISKCVNALPNTYILSEINPLAERHLNLTKPDFRPTDIISLIRYAQVPFQEDLIKQVFETQIKVVNEEVENNGGHLVLRIHSHTDFNSKESRYSLATTEILNDSFDILKLATVRHPVDSYLSLEANGWLHFSPANFEEYCRRYLLFIAEFQDSELIKYEDFVDDPVSTTKSIAKRLSLPFDESFLSTFHLSKLTGDSGRSGYTIEPRPRKVLQDSFLEEIEASVSYHELVAKLAYN